MAHTIGSLPARASSAGNPITVSSVSVAQGVTVFVVMLHVSGATNRAGGALTIGDCMMTQANTVQKAAASPEGSTELWYCVTRELLPGSHNLVIPNTGALTIRYQIAMAAAHSGCRSFLRQAGGGNGTTTNPTPGTVTCDAGDIVFATVVNGAATWAPTAQAGTVIQNTDDGALGGGTQYSVRGSAGAFTCGWTFGTSDDWGAVVACFGEHPAPAIQTHMGFRAGDGMTVAEKVR